MNISTYPRDLFGPQGRLIEIMSAEDQALAVTVMKQAEASFTVGDPELSYWWTGLQDQVLIIIIIIITVITVIIIIIIIIVSRTMTMSGCGSAAAAPWATPTGTPTPLPTWMDTTAWRCCPAPNSRYISIQIAIYLLCL